MKLRIHTCKADSCQRLISTRLLMCLEHWRMVPAPLKREVVDLHKQARYLGRPDVAAAYRSAADRAVAIVKEKQERKAQGGPTGSLFNQA